MTVKAPTYTELFNPVNELQNRIASLEAQQRKPPQVVAEPLPQHAAPTSADLRLLPDLNRSVPIFTGHESSCVAEDWLGSVDALATIYN